MKTEKELEEEYIQDQRKKHEKDQRDKGLKKHQGLIEKILLSFREEYGKEEWKRKRNRSLRQWIWKGLGGRYPHPLTIARVGDEIQLENQYRTVYETAAALGYDVMLRREIPQREARKLPRIAIGERTLYLRKWSEG